MQSNKENVGTSLSSFQLDLSPLIFQRPLRICLFQVAWTLLQANFQVQDILFPF